ncbi:ABC transporter substrate-binding protein [Smaragdicoccus niigatensis]|uniref:ABC transporter substrate-binding protein n=1 Tax=Smaragdicoccus niigatensis TaxID=359359 RepID=UPI001FDF1369|nr:ABC transporter substrate-binding protein [Smaragdicoccus niigatensis]
MSIRTQFRFRRKPAVRVVALAVAAATVLTACGSSESSESGPDASGVTTLRYQGWNNQVTLPELADYLGFFDGKIKLNWVGNTISGPQDIQSAATGETDFGGAFGGAVAKLVSSGADIKAVINYYGGDDKDFGAYYVPADSPIKSARDLIGKKVAVNTLGGQNEADIFNELKKEGLTQEEIKQVELVTLPPPNQEDALRKGQVDAAGLSGQFKQRADAAGGLRVLWDQHSEYGGPFNGGPYVFRNDFIKKNPDAVRAFVDGVGKAIQWARLTPRDEVIKTFTTIIEARHRPNENTDTLKYWLTPGVPSYYGYIEYSDFERWADWLKATGAVKELPSANELFTNEFNTNATTAVQPADAQAPQAAKK